MARNWDIPKRHLVLSLYSGSENEQSESNLLSRAGIDANVSFSTSAGVFGQAAEANVNITGLTVDKMAHLATSFNAYRANTEKNSLTIDAGYNNAHGMIYQGLILEGIPNIDSANYSIDLKCFSYYPYMAKKIESISKDGEVLVKDICQEIAGQMGVSLEYKADESLKLTDYSYRDQSPEDQMRNLGREANIDIWIENRKTGGIMRAKPKGKPFDSSDILTVDYHNMIGSPLPNPTGCEVNIRLNPAVQGGQKVNLTSLKYPQLSGSDYFISSFYHSGETYGSKWQTTLKLTKSSLYEQQ